MAPSTGAVVVVANTHCTGFGIQNVCAMAFGVHPGIHDFFRRNVAPCGILASSGIRHAVLAENSIPLGTIGTNVRIDGCDLFGALLSGTIVVAVAQLNGLQASLCALVVYAAQELVLISFVLKADVGIFFFDGGRTRSLAAFAVTGLRDAAPKTTARVIAAAAIFFRVRISSFIRHPP